MISDYYMFYIILHNYHVFHVLYKIFINNELCTVSTKDAVDSHHSYIIINKHTKRVIKELVMSSLIMNQISELIECFSQCCPNLWRVTGNTLNQGRVECWHLTPNATINWREEKVQELHTCCYIRIIYYFSVCIHQGWYWYHSISAY